MTEQQFYSHPDRLDAPKHPHWSVSCDWRPGRWDPMSNAPASTREIRGRDAKGNVLEPMHFACDMSGEDQPSFQGWFVPNSGSSGFHQVHPVEWQPLSAGVRGTHTARRLTDREVMEIKDLPNDVYDFDGAIRKFCEVNGITLSGGVSGTAGGQQHE